MRRFGSRVTLIARDPQHLRDNLAAAELTLPAETLDRLDGLAAESQENQKA